MIRSFLEANLNMKNSLNRFLAMHPTNVLHVMPYLAATYLCAKAVVITKDAVITADTLRRPQCISLPRVF